MSEPMILVCYTDHDSEQAEALVVHLQNAGVPAILNNLSVESGAAFGAFMRSTIRPGDYCLLLWSRAAEQQLLVWDQWQADWLRETVACRIFPLVARVEDHPVPASLQARVISTRWRAGVQIGIVTALPKEYAAVEALLEAPRSYPIPGRGAGRYYLLGEVPAANSGRHTVVLAMADMGNSSAAARATLLLEHFPDITYVLMVGIAGGVPYPERPDEHVRLGDLVVLGQQGVVQYDFDKETSTEIMNRHPPRPPSARLLEHVRLLEAGELRRERPWLAHIAVACAKLGVTRPLPETDVLTSTLNEERTIAHPPDPARNDGQPRIFVGPIASANKLLKNPIKRDELRNRFGVKAIEMEGSGVADASWNHEVGYLIIRGVSDYCDSNKGDAWQNYAAIAAAAYSRALLESLPSQQQAAAADPLGMPTPADAVLSAPYVDLFPMLELGARRLAHLWQRDHEIGAVLRKSVLPPLPTTGPVVTPPAAAEIYISSELFDCTLPLPVDLSKPVGVLLDQVVAYLGLPKRLAVRGSVGIDLRYRLFYENRPLQRLRPLRDEGVKESAVLTLEITVEDFARVPPTARTQAIRVYRASPLEHQEILEMLTRLGLRQLRG